MPRKKRLHVVGYYGMSNFGDDLFCDVIEDRASQLFAGFQLKIIGRSRGFGQKLYSSTTIVGSILRMAMGIYSVVRADLIVLGGGSVLWRLSGVRLLQWKLSRLTRTSFQSLGVSIGPFASVVDKLGITEFLESNSRVIVRDKESMTLGVEMGLGAKLQMGGDLAALYRRPPSRRSEVDLHVRIIGLALCNFPGYVEIEDGLLESLATAIHETAVPGREDHIQVLSLNGHPEHGDDELSLRAVEFLVSRGLAATSYCYSDLGVAKIWDLMAALDAMVAVRLHAAISAYLSGVPFALFEYHQKCRDFCDEVGQAESLRWTQVAEGPTHIQVLEDLLRGSRPPSFSPEDYKSRSESIYLFGAESE